MPRLDAYRFVEIDAREHCALSDFRSVPRPENPGQGHFNQATRASHIRDLTVDSGSTCSSRSCGPFAYATFAGTSYVKMACWFQLSEDGRAVEFLVDIPDLDISPGEVPSFTAKQGQYLAFIYTYTQIHGRPPAEADPERFCGASPPAIHSMILRLEGLGLLSRVPGQARTLKVLVPTQSLPVLVRSP